MSIAVPQGDRYRSVLFARKAGDGFWGAIPMSEAKVANVLGSRMSAIDSELVSTFKAPFGMTEPVVSKFDDPARYYSAYYGAGLAANSEVSINLDTVPGADLKWKSSLPVTISYM